MSGAAPALRVAVLTISDRCTRGEAVDTAGPAVSRLLEERLGWAVETRETLADERDRIAGRLRELSSAGYALALTVGGTGCAPRDVTPEATRDVLEREAPGLAEAMRAASLGKTPHAMLSRAVAGLRGRTLIINLPGSERGATENLEALLDALPHALRQAAGDTAHPDTDTRP